MKKIILPILATLAFATPALANDARVEVRAGVIWTNGTSEDAWGVAAGYDFDLGSKAFAGVEVSGDKIGATGTKVAFGATGRLGIKASDATRLYGVGGYATEVCDGCDAQWHLGAGVEHQVSGPVYVKAEYRHYFENDFVVGGDALVAGVGVRL